MARDYTAETIDVAKDLEQVRRRPTAFVTDRSTGGQVHMIREILDNSVDELVLKDDDSGTIYICLFRDRVNKKYQIAVLDNGRGIPAPALVDVTTVLGASGKARADTAYTASGGLFGFGLKVSAALSTKFRCITSNYREDVVGSIYLEDGKIVDHTDTIADISPGVLTIVEPDLKYFNNEDTFMEVGYLDLVGICRQFNIFNSNINFQFYLYERGIPKEIWTKPAIEALALFQNILTRKHIVEYDSTSYPDKAAYLLDIWKVDKKPIWEDTWYKLPASSEDKLSFNIKIFFMKKSQNGRPKYFVTINNISLPDLTGNSATIAFMSMLRTEVAMRQTDPKYKTFVLNEYVFPTLMVAMGINYHGAELSGATKTSFRDNAFAKQFLDDLMNIARYKGEDYWKALVDVIQPDIDYRYSQMYDTAPKKAESRQVFMKLNFSNNYFACEEYDPEKSELYIVEGTSAGNILSTRDKRYQAVYMTRGKPPNCATRMDKIVDNRAKLIKDPLYQDLMHIQGYDPDRIHLLTNPRVRFNRLIVTTDADPDGYHIRVLHLNDHYILNPIFISAGYMWLANPPLYSMDITKRDKLFLRDRTALMDARVKFIYKKALTIKLDTPAGIITPTPETFRDICYLTHYLGNHFDLVAQQLNIPLLILERLVLAIDAIFPVVDYLKLTSYFDNCDAPGFVKVSVNEAGRFIVVSVGEEDYPIGLEAIGELVLNHLQKLVVKYKYKDIIYLVSSNFAGAKLAPDTPLSMMALYILMKKMDDMFHVRRYKGLGEMAPEDCYDTIMNPEKRSLTQVTSIGDPTVNYGLLGDDSFARKMLMSETGLMSKDMQISLDD